MLTPSLDKGRRTNCCTTSFTVVFPHSLSGARIISSGAMCAPSMNQVKAVHKDIATSALAGKMAWRLNAARSSFNRSATTTGCWCGTVCSTSDSSPPASLRAIRTCASSAVGLTLNSSALATLTRSYSSSDSLARRAISLWHVSPLPVSPSMKNPRQAGEGVRLFIR